MSSIEDSRIEEGKDLSIDNYTANEKLESDRTLKAIDLDETQRIIHLKLNCIKMMSLIMKKLM